MKTLTYSRILFLCLILLLIYYLCRLQIATYKQPVVNSVTAEYKNVQQSRSKSSDRSKITIAVVACGDRLQETLTMIKSALMLSKARLNVIVISESNLIENFSEKLSEWKSSLKNRFTFQVIPLTFPVDNAKEWKSLFKPCASQRLFLPNILKDTKALLYVDTDVLFLTPPETVWEYFYKMNSSQMAALAPEHEDPNVGWYNRFARHPYYGKLGVNSGVMLMNLTRMREFQWVDYVLPIYRKYKLKITWGDQDIINIIFHFHPDKLYIYSCRYNFRPDHCMYMSVCKEAEKYGVAVIHGSRGFFHSEKQPVFKEIYRAFEEFHFGDDIYREFYLRLEAFLEATEDTNCGHIKEAYLKNLRKYIVDDETES